MFNTSQVSIIFDDSVQSISFYRKPGPKKAYVIEHENRGRTHNVEIEALEELKRLRDAIDGAIAFEESLLVGNEVFEGV